MLEFLVWHRDLLGGSGEDIMDIGPSGLLGPYTQVRSSSFLLLQVRMGGFGVIYVSGKDHCF